MSDIGGIGLIEKDGDLVDPFTFGMLLEGQRPPRIHVAEVPLIFKYVRDCVCLGVGVPDLINKAGVASGKPGVAAAMGQDKWGCIPLINKTDGTCRIAYKPVVLINKTVSCSHCCL